DGYARKSGDDWLVRHCQPAFTQVTRAMAADEEATIARDRKTQRGEGSVEPVFIDPQKLLLGQQLFAFHLPQGQIVDGEYAQFGIHALLVQLLVLLIKLLELRVGLDQRVDLVLRLPFEHDYLLRAETRTPRPCGTGRSGMEIRAGHGRTPAVFRSIPRKLSGTGSRHGCTGPVLRCPDDENVARTI